MLDRTVKNKNLI